MPEGDSIVKLAARLGPIVTGRTIRALDAPGCRGGARLVDTHITSTETRGKHLVMVSSSGLALRTHLAMHGRWQIVAPSSPSVPARMPTDQIGGSARRRSVTMQLDDGTVLRGRRLGEVEIIRWGETMPHRLARLGPDLCAVLEAREWAQIADRALTRAAQADSPTVGDVLLDQWVASGIGNVYKSEVCFAVGVHPDGRAVDLPAERWAELYATAHAQLRANLRPGPRRTTSRGLAVYRRIHKPCHRCGASIRRSYSGRSQRSSYWCPHCQSR